MAPTERGKGWLETQSTSHRRPTIEDIGIVLVSLSAPLVLKNEENVNYYCCTRSCSQRAVSYRILESCYLTYFTPIYLRRIISWYPNQSVQRPETASVLFKRGCPRVVALTAPQTSGVLLSCVHYYRAFRTVRAALQTAAAVVSSHELVSGGNGGNSYVVYLVVERIYARPRLIQFAH